MLIGRHQKHLARPVDAVVVATTAAGGDLVWWYIALSGSM